MKQLDPKVTWIFFTNFTFRWLVVIVPVSFYLVNFILNSTGGKDIHTSYSIWSYGFLLLSEWAKIMVPVIFVLIIIFWLWARLSFEFYKYELTTEGFKKEYGIIWKKYVTIPYDRIQNIDIFRGILARILGLSDLQIQTAGSVTAGSYGAFAEGRLPGLSRVIAEQLRDELVKRTHSSNKSNQGL